MDYTQYKIGVITNINGGLSMQDLRAVAKEHNVTFESIPFDYIPLTGFNTSSLVDSISQYDIIYYRTGMRGIYLHRLAEILQQKNIPFVNFNVQHHELHGKIQQMIHADKHGITHPKSLYTKNFDYDMIARELGTTFVVKPDNGSKGNGVALIDSADTLARYAADKKKPHYLFQEYIEGAVEYRIYTIGNKGIVSCKKHSPADDFRTNLHLGATISETEIEFETPLLHYGGQIAQVFDADLSGIDVLVKDGIFYFLELNLQPGWGGLKKSVGMQYSKETVQYILEKAHTHYSCVCASDLV